MWMKERSLDISRVKVGIGVSGSELRGSDGDIERAEASVNYLCSPSSYTVCDSYRVMVSDKRPPAAHGSGHFTPNGAFVCI